jgi:hypothetical protein
VAGEVTREEGERRLREKAAEIMARAEALPENEPPAEYGKKGGRGHKAVLARKAFSGGSDPAYLAARIKRDHPDLAAKVRAGELSANGLPPSERPQLRLRVAGLQIHKFW